jgi:hypothetical protein
MPAGRSRAISASHAAIGLVFFFSVGLAGGAAYRFLSADEPDQQIANRAPAISAVPASQTAPEPASLADAVAPDLASAPAPPPAASAQPGVPSPEIEPTAPQPVPYAAVSPHAIPSQRAAPHHPAAPPPKPRLAAKTPHPAPASPQPVALHAPPVAPGNLVGPFRVQFGVFANEDNARRVQWAIEATGLKVEVTQAPGATGHALYYLRSPAYHDYAAALSAAQTVQDRVQHFVNAIPIDYAILGDHSPDEQQADAR